MASATAVPNEPTTIAVAPTTLADKKEIVATTTFCKETTAPIQKKEIASNANVSTLGKETTATISTLADKKEADKKEIGINVEEEQYLQLVRDVIATGVQKNDRTGVGTLSKFGHQMRFSLRNGQFPLLTTKQVYWKGVVEELLWMLRGCTDSKTLNEQKVKIWNDNASRATLDKMGFHQRAEGDLGPIYGFQWRHFGAKYINSATDYSGQGIDQIALVMKQIKTDPNSRRILFSAWNPSDVAAMALPPCHVSAQFTVSSGELSCLMFQRSNDLGLGIPFNIASYSLLTVLLAHACGLKPGEFIHTMGDCHVYLNHVTALKEQLLRTPKAFPRLSIKATTAPKADVADYLFSDLLLENYTPFSSIKMDMAI